MHLERTSFGKRLGTYAEAIALPSQPIVEGRLLRMVGLTLEAEGLRAAVGSRCLVINDDSYHPVQVEAEVMGFAGPKVFLMPVGSIHYLAADAAGLIRSSSTPSLIACRALLTPSFTTTFLM